MKTLYTATSSSDGVAWSGGGPVLVTFLTSETWLNGSAGNARGDRSCPVAFSPDWLLGQPIDCAESPITAQRPARRRTFVNIPAFMFASRLCPHPKFGM